jgi:hypothetical protein
MPFCSICNRDLPKKNWSRHRKSHSQKKKHYLLCNTHTKNWPKHFRTITHKDSLERTVVIPQFVFIELLAIRKGSLADLADACKTTGTHAGKLSDGFALTVPDNVPSSSVTEIISTIQPFEKPLANLAAAFEILITHARDFFIPFSD